MKGNEGNNVEIEHFLLLYNYKNGNNKNGYGGVRNGAAFLGVERMFPREFASLERCLNSLRANVLGRVRPPSPENPGMASKTTSLATKVAFAEEFL